MQYGDVRIVDDNFVLIQRDLGQPYPGAGNLVFRPTTAPEPPKHRVEDETWSVEGKYIITDSLDYERGRGNVCEGYICGSANSKFWPERSKRIVAGQEALKLLQNYVDEIPIKLAEWRSTWGQFAEEHPFTAKVRAKAQSILDSTK